MSILAYNRLIDNISQTYFYIYGIRDSIHKFQFKKLGLCLFKKAFFEHYIVYVPTACPALPYPTLPYPTLPYPTLPYPTLPYPTLPYPTLPYPTLPYPTLPYPTLPYPTLQVS